MTDKNKLYNIDIHLKTRDNQKENALIAAMAIYSVKKHKIYTFQSDVIAHNNPNVKEIDRFVSFPIYLCEDTTKEGMLVVSTKLNEVMGLIEETQKDTGNFVLIQNAKRMQLFVYEDALSVSNYS